MTSQKLIYLIVSTAVDEPEGAPSGVIYAALQGHVDYVTYVETVDALRKAGLITVSHHVITATEKGKELISMIHKSLAQKHLAYQPGASALAAPVTITEPHQPYED